MKPENEAQSLQTEKEFWEWYHTHGRFFDHDSCALRAFNLAKNLLPNPAEAARRMGENKAEPKAGENDKYFEAWLSGLTRQDWREWLEWKRPTQPIPVTERLPEAGRAFWAYDGKHWRMVDFPEICGVGWSEVYLRSNHMTHWLYCEPPYAIPPEPASEEYGFEKWWLKERGKNSANKVLCSIEDARIIWHASRHSAKAGEGKV